MVSASRARSRCSPRTTTTSSASSGPSTLRRITCTSSQPARTTPSSRGAALAADLEAAGVEVCYDDRSKVSPGVKFKDAELIGAPVHPGGGARAGDGVVELKTRATGERRSAAGRRCGQGFGIVADALAKLVSDPTLVARGERHSAPGFRRADGRRSRDGGGALASEPRDTPSHAAIVVAVAFADYIDARFADSLIAARRALALALGCGPHVAALAPRCRRTCAVERTREGRECPRKRLCRGHGAACRIGGHD